MGTPQPWPTPRELTDAFIHPPVLVPIGERFEDDLVVVVSHVEIWPWRLVVRGLVADPNFEPDAIVLPPTELSSPADDNSALDAIGQHRHRWRRGIDWMNSWSVVDDAGTEFVATGWKGSPFDGQYWCDLELQYEGVAARSARRLSISGPVIGSIDVNLRK